MAEPEEVVAKRYSGRFDAAIQRPLHRLVGRQRPYLPRSNRRGGQSGSGLEHHGHLRDDALSYPTPVGFDLIFQDSRAIG